MNASTLLTAAAPHHTKYPSTTQSPCSGAVPERAPFERKPPMISLSRRVHALVLVLGLLAGTLATATTATAQCAMMGGSGGGHDHGAMSTGHASKSTGSEKKLRKSIDLVLSDDRGRAMLVDELLNDRAFMESLVQRMVAIPEWRALVAQQLGAAPAAPDARSAPPASAAPATAIYTCPMHAEVTSSTPGDCPKCGMALVRKERR